jgi:hypothetical protein
MSIKRWRGVPITPVGWAVVQNIWRRSLLSGVFAWLAVVEPFFRE